MQELIHGVFYSEAEEIEKENENDETNKANQVNSNKVSSEKKTKEEIRVEVLNGTGKNSTLQEVVKILKDNGIKVVKTGNTSQISKTIITNKKDWRICF